MSKEIQNIVRKIRKYKLKLETNDSHIYKIKLDRYGKKLDRLRKGGAQDEDEKALDQTIQNLIDPTEQIERLQGIADKMREEQSENNANFNGYVDMLNSIRNDLEDINKNLDNVLTQRVQHV